MCRGEKNFAPVRMLNRARVHVRCAQEEHVQLKRVYRLLVYCIIVLAVLLFSPLHTTQVLPDGGAPNLVYVTGTFQGIRVIDIAQQKLTETLAVQENLKRSRNFALGNDGRFLYVPQPEAGRVVMLATSTGKTVCSASLPGQPALLALDNTTNTLYVAGESTSDIIALDALNCERERSFHVQGVVHGIATIAVNRESSEALSVQLWIASTQAVTVFECGSGKQLRAIVLGEEPESIVIPQGPTAYVTTRQGSLLALDLWTYRVLSLLRDGRFGTMDYDEGTGELYVPDQRHNSLLVLEPVTIGSTKAAAPKEPNRVIPLEARPESVAITSDGQLGFVALDNGFVAMLDIPGRQRINTIHIEGQPRALITGLYPPLVPVTAQETTLSGTLVGIAAYGMLVIMITVPLLAYWYLARKGRAKDV